MACPLKLQIHYKYLSKQINKLHDNIYHISVCHLGGKEE